MDDCPTNRTSAWSRLFVSHAHLIIPSVQSTWIGISCPASSFADSMSNNASVHATIIHIDALARCCPRQDLPIDIYCLHSCHHLKSYLPSAKSERSLNIIVVQGPVISEEPFRLERLWIRIFHRIVKHSPGATASMCAAADT